MHGIGSLLGNTIEIGLRFPHPPPLEGGMRRANERKSKTNLTHTPTPNTRFLLRSYVDPLPKTGSVWKTPWGFRAPPARGACFMDVCHVCDCIALVLEDALRALGFAKPKRLGEAKRKPGLPCPRVPGSPRVKLSRKRMATKKTQFGG